MTPGTPDPRLAQMRSDMPLSAWPPISDSRHAVLAALVQQLDHSQWLPAQHIAALPPGCRSGRAAQGDGIPSKTRVEAENSVVPNINSLADFTPSD